ncbi:hypothetical protein HDU67_003974 [Dinochytrium kinnereticum]|nr:hypothetical protein HDU67_003974 [Dinochytrium kinnereticum]
MLKVGASRTRSSDSYVTDSAAGATAFACEVKTFNGAIGMTPDKVPCGTILEAAKAEGYLTGLVATSRITHATPASFSAHVPDRNMESEIALYQLGNYSLGRNVDLMFGGGACFFKPRNMPGSCRLDSIDPSEAAISKGWNMLSTRKEFDAITDDIPFPLMGLLASDHMNYEIDRDPKLEPSLSEMALKALDLLKAKSKGTPGFFIMIEGSRIDMAAHSNDPATHVREILEYNNAISVVQKWVQKTPGSVMISVSDHETGGMSVAKQLTEAYPDYKWNPDALERVKNSSVVIAKALFEYPGDLGEFVTSTVLPNWMSVHDATDAEVSFLSKKGRSFFEYDSFVSKMLSDRAFIGWSTHGHSAVDVNLYSYGLHSEKLAGNHENTEIGTFMRNFLKVDLKKITKKMKDSGPELWMTEKREEDVALPSSIYPIQHFHH